MEERIVVYPANALQHPERNILNSEVAQGLEKMGYRTYFAQRDGFDFPDLKKALSKELKEKSVDSAAKKITYCLDIGKFMPKSDIILINYNQPLDENIVMESSYAKKFGKFTIGFGEESKKSQTDNNKMYHENYKYPAFRFSVSVPYSADKETSEKDLAKSLVYRINQMVTDRGTYHNETMSRYVKSNPDLIPFFDGSAILFHNIEEIRSKKSLEKIVSRYMKNKKFFDGIRLIKE